MSGNKYEIEEQIGQSLNIKLIKIKYNDAYLNCIDFLHRLENYPDLGKCLTDYIKEELKYPNFVFEVLPINKKTKLSHVELSFKKEDPDTSFAKDAFSDIIGNTIDSHISIGASRSDAKETLIMPSHPDKGQPVDQTFSSMHGFINNFSDAAIECFWKHVGHEGQIKYAKYKQVTISTRGAIKYFHLLIQRQTTYKNQSFLKRSINIADNIHTHKVQYGNKLKIQSMSAYFVNGVATPFTEIKLDNGSLLYIFTNSWDAPPSPGKNISGIICNFDLPLKSLKPKISSISLNVIFDISTNELEAKPIKEGISEQEFVFKKFDPMDVTTGCIPKPEFNFNDKPKSLLKIDLLGNAYTPFLTFRDKLGSATSKLPEVYVSVTPIDLIKKHLYKINKKTTWQETGDISEHPILLIHDNPPPTPFN